MNPAPKEDFEAILAAKREYEEVKKGYGVRFFREDARGTEKRPDDIPKGPMPAEGWEEVLPLELAFLRMMIQRKAAGAMNPDRSERRRVSASFDGVRTVDEARALATCLWLERSAKFPHSSTKKAFKADEALAVSGDLRYKTRRNAAVTDNTRLLAPFGLTIRDGMFRIEDEDLDLQRLRSTGIRELVDSVEIPLEVLARIDGGSLETVDSMVSWLKTFLKEPKLSKHVIAELGDQVRACGVRLIGLRVCIDPAIFDIEKLKAIEVPNAFGNESMLLGDLSRTHGFSLDNESDVMEWGTALLRGYGTRAVDQLSVGGGVRERLLRSLEHVIIPLIKKEMVPSRKAEIAVAISEGGDIMDYYNEIIEGYQAELLWYVINRGYRGHRGNPDFALEIFGEINLTVATRLPRFEFREGSNPADALENFIYTAANSAMKDARFTGVLSGVPMRSRPERLVWSHAAEVEAALRDFEGGQDDRVRFTTVSRRTGKKHDHNHTREQLQDALAKRKVGTGGLVPLEGVIGFAKNDQRKEVRLDHSAHVDNSILPANISIPDDGMPAARKHLLAQLYNTIDDETPDERKRLVIRWQIEKMLEINEGRVGAHLAADLGLTATRVSQIANERNTNIIIKRILSHFSWEEIQLMRGETDGLDPMQLLL